MKKLEKSRVTAAQPQRSASRGTVSQTCPRVAKVAIVEAMEVRVLLSGVMEEVFLTSQDEHTEPIISTAHFAPTTVRSITPTGLTPEQVRKAYGFDRISLPGISADGAGQTIAIISAYDNPRIVDTTDPNFENSDLAVFDRQFGLPHPPSLRKVDIYGGTSFSAPNADWATELAMDVQWVHALAPMANILIVQAPTASVSDMYAAVGFAQRQTDVSVVSMSFTTPEPQITFLPSIGSLVPFDGSKGVTFVAATGDAGQPGGNPSFHPNVVAVGGTKLNVLPDGTYDSETAWSLSGGGASRYEKKPRYQAEINPGGDLVAMRMTPDVAFVADPTSGVAVYDSFGDPTAPWLTLGGTSVGAPAWSALFAIVNQGREASGVGRLNGFSQALPGIYAAPDSAFHDIVVGDNGLPALPGFDMVTGRGTPMAATLVDHLVGYGTGQISGTVYGDANESGAIDSIDDVIGGWTVFLDADDDGALDAGEISTIADDRGGFYFDHLLPGQYAVRAISATGYITNSGSAVVTLSSSQSVHGVNLPFLKTANLGKVIALIYNDVDGDGDQDQNEVGLSGWQVEISGNGKTFTGITDETGRFEAGNLTKGAYKVMATNQPGWLMSTWYVIAFLQTGSHHQVEIEVTKGSFLQGSVYEDRNKNSVIEETEQMVGVPVYADLNDNGVLDPGEPSDDTNSIGMYQVGALEAGTYKIRPVLPAGYAFEDPESGAIEVGIGHLTYKLKLNFKVRATTSRITGHAYKDANFSGSFDVGETRGWDFFKVYVDENENGEHDASEPSTFANVDSFYHLKGLSPGRHVVRVEVPDFWKPSVPVDATRIVDLDTAADNVDFGFTDVPGVLYGKVINDLNGNGRRDKGEPAMEGQVVWIDDDKDRVRDSSERWTVTDAEGAYRFDGLVDGQWHTVRLAVPKGWFATGWIEFSRTIPPDRMTVATPFMLSNKRIIRIDVTDDLDADGLLDLNETINSRAAGVVVYHDANDNGMWDVGEMQTERVETYAAFTGIPQGNQVFRLHPIPGYRVTNPADGRLVVYNPGSSLGFSYGRFMHTFKARIEGAAFFDLDEDGVLDPEDLRRSALTVTLDSDLDGIGSLGEPTVVTDSEGRYAFDNLPLGGYRVLVGEEPGVVRAFDDVAMTIAAGTVTTANLGFRLLPPLLTPPTEALEGTASDAAQLWQLGAFESAGTPGPHVVEVDWGDGTSATQWSMSTPGLINAEHAYVNAGLFNVKVRVTSAVGGSVERAYPITILPRAVTTLGFNFQPASAPTVAGYLIDGGSTFGARNGQSYGWTSNHTDAVIDRNKNGDQLLDTNVGVKAAQRWELAVPNGTYTVKVGVGDSGALSRNNVWVEGKQLFNYQSLGVNAFDSKSIIVTVTDGRLTLGVGGAATGTTRIGYVEVTLPTSPPPTSPPPTSPPPTSPPPTSPPPTSPPPTSPPPPTSSGINVNFQPAGAPTVAGYLVDAGDTYAARNGQTYGWTASNTAGVYDRGINGDQLLDTTLGVVAQTRWELAVPSGQYTVTVGVGDAGANSTNNIWVEGKQLFNYQSLAANAFDSKSITVNVTDGKLTVGVGSASTGLTKINYIQVASPSSPPPTSPPPTSPPPPPTSPPPTSPPPTSPPPTSPPPTTTGPGVLVNFQPSGAATVDGYLVDGGLTYGSRNVQTYGWTTSHTDAVVDRNINGDQLLDTNVAVKNNARWELAVPNGTYTVKVSVGDAGASSRNNVWIEGKQLFNYQSQAANVFSTKSITVSVTDGRLTLGIGSSGSGLVKLNYIEVT